MPKKERIFEHVEVIDLGDKGNAIGRTTDGRIVLVSEAVPGDVVSVRAKRKKKGMFLTSPIEYHSLSGDRTEPFCRHFHTCGGCKWQHLQYEKQLYFKEKSVRDALRRIGGIEDPEVLPIAGATDQTHYRNKLEYTFTDQRWLTDEQIKSDAEFDRRGLGFHIPGQFCTGT